MVSAFFQLCKYRDVVVLFLRAEHRTMGVSSIILVQNYFELKVTMHWRGDADDCRILQRECHFVSLIVPEMIHSVGLTVVEVCLLT